LEQTVKAKENEGVSLLDEAKLAIQQGFSYLSKVNWSVLLRTSTFWFGVGSFIGLILMFWPLLKTTGQTWIVNDYYSHGWIVPILIAWQLKVRYEDWQKIPITKGYTALIAFVPIVFFQFIGFIGEFWVIQCLMLVSAILASLWLIFGFKRAWFVTMPIGGAFIDGYTNDLQILSTTVAEKLLSLFGFSPIRLSPTDIQLNTYALTVAVPCSGLKLMVAVACFTTHFVLIARKEFSFNILMFLLVVPLCMFINGLRIALIGVVGELQGHDAAAKFHDYSGYITLLICFFILFKFARLFGWKD
jgi:exosortase